MIKVTVLIPTLNSMGYMKECIDSVLGQTLRELEILVIDAGSTDGTLQLIEEYQQNDDRIQLVLSDKKSYGYQLNKGIVLAKGHYIGVVESDDVIEADMYEKLYEIAEKEDLDFAKGNFANYAVTGNKQKMIMTENTIFHGIYNQVFCPNDYKNIYIEDFYLWRGIYKREFLQTNHISLHESPGAAYQDIGFLYQVFTKAQRGIYLDKCFYCYRRNNKNSSTYSPKAFSYLANEYEYIMKEHIGYKKEDIEWATYFYYKMFIQLRSRVRMWAFHERNIEEVQKDIIAIRNLLVSAYDKKEINFSVWDMQTQTEFFMLLEDYVTYLEYYRTQIKGKKNCLFGMLKQLKQYREIILVSDSKMLPFVYVLLNTYNLDTITCICDNDNIKWGTQRMGLNIISIEEAGSQVKEKAYIILNTRAKKELREQIKTLGAADEQIYSYEFGTDWFLIG